MIGMTDTKETIISSFKEYLEEQLLDEEFAEAYEQVSEEMDFALALAMRREELGLTQQALASETGIKQPMIARIESGQMPLLQRSRDLQRIKSQHRFYWRLMLVPLRVAQNPAWLKRLDSQRSV